MERDVIDVILGRRKSFTRAEVEVRLRKAVEYRKRANIVICMECPMAPVCLLLLEDECPSWLIVRGYSERAIIEEIMEKLRKR